jgi:hypothetical protein
MQKHRVWVAITVTWLFVLFNIERLNDSINLASFVYVLTTLLGVTMLLCRPARNLPISLSIASALILFVTIKCLFANGITSANLHLTLAEAISIVLTTVLAVRIGRDTDLFTDAARQLMLLNLHRRVPNNQDAEPDMQREIHRARCYERPLSLVTLRPETAALPDTLSCLIHELRQELAEDYALGRIADLLMSETKNNDLLSYEHGQFVLLLPEANRNDAARLTARLRERIGELFDIRVETGIADFPNDELTYAGLLNRAQPTETSDLSTSAEQSLECEALQLA